MRTRKTLNTDPFHAVFTLGTKDNLQTLNNSTSLTQDPNMKIALELLKFKERLM